MTEVERQLLSDGRVKILSEEIIDRYQPKIVYDQVTAESYGECDLNDVKSNLSKIYVFGGNYKSLNTGEDFGEDLPGTLDEDFAAWKKYIKDTYKDEYVPKVLCAYIHSGTSFYINDTGAKICQFDSGVLGFIAVRKDIEADTVANMLTDVWSNDYKEYQVYDHYEDEVIDSFMCSGSMRQNEIKMNVERLEKAYNVSFENVNTEY